MKTCPSIEPQLWPVGIRKTCLYLTETYVICNINNCLLLVLVIGHTIGHSNSYNFSVGVDFLRCQYKIIMDETVN